MKNAMWKEREELSCVFVREERERERKSIREEKSRRGLRREEAID